MANEYFVGLRASDDNVDDERPYNWRMGIRDLFPNGMVSLTGLTAMMSSETVDDPQYHWWDQKLISQRADVTGVYDSASESAYAAAADAKGFNHFWKISTAESKMFRAGMIVHLRDKDKGDSADFRARIENIIPKATYVLIGTKSLEAAPFLASTYGPNTIDVMYGIGNSNPEGGVRPESISIAPVKRFNYTQIFRDPLDLTRTRIRTKLRTMPAYKKAKKDCLLQHGMGMEKAFIWGVQSEEVGINGKPERTTRGVWTDIKANGVVQNFTTDPSATYDGQAWVDRGDQWIDEHLEEIFRFGSTERLAFAGSGALLGIQTLIKSLGNYDIKTRQMSWGITVREWITPFGMLSIMTHPLFTFEETNRNSMMIFEPANISYRYITDTMFKPDKLWQVGGGDGVDGPREEYLTEAGLELVHPETGGILSGIGQDNP